jgi:phospholipid/cholesterol/gamma-HCH transport system substrate-binding protein
MVALLVIGLATAFAFERQLPFGRDYRLNAVVSSSSQLLPGSRVRVAGVDVGSVEGVVPGPGNTSVVKMRVHGAARPVHADATLRIKPRTALEGSFYVDLDPGLPSVRKLPSGATIPRSRTAAPVQLDQVLDVFDAPTRASLQGSLAQLAAGLDGRRRRGSGARALRDANRELARALASVTRVVKAARGPDPGALRRMIASSASATDQLARNPAALSGVVTSTRRIASALAADDAALAAGVRETDGLLVAAPRALTAFDRVLPALRHFAIAAEPALQTAPRTLPGAGALLRQLRLAASPAELPRLVRALTTVTPDLPGLERDLGALSRRVTPVSRCVASHVMPVLDQRLDDGRHSTGRPVWQDLVHSFVTVGSATGNYDANGKAIRLGLGDGDGTLTTTLPGGGPLRAANAPRIEGTDPVWLGPGVSPQWHPEQPCANQALPNLGLRRITGTPAGIGRERP